MSSGINERQKRGESEFVRGSKWKERESKYISKSVSH